MTDIPPMEFDWDGEHLTPLQPRRADRHYVVGESYWLAPYEARSARSHNHFFACLNEAWANLPEDMADQFPSPEHLRKKMLIKTGFRDERSVVCASKAEALRVAAFIDPLDGYAVVVVKESTVLHFTAKSQSQRAMGAKVFQESKEAVLGAVSKLIGVSTEALRANARQAA
ncbi:hypothetical protein LCGC14_2657750 [marine sediment metagenome]|uniref:Uncharacterized protein n=1 Tax=marine sediment metagenome TaxID=412755 RepID=A0A0F8ZSU2_9ZZZZ